MIPRRAQSRGSHGFWSLGALVGIAVLSCPIADFGPIARAADRDKRAASDAKTPGRAQFIDRLLEASWTSAGVKPAKVATDEEFLRRAYLDLLGRIPSVQEARAFLHTREPDRREKLVDYLLQDADYPKNFATKWTVLLIGRGNQGRMVDRGALASWLRRQFAANRPWNEVVYDLVTASGSNKENGAVNYVLAHLESEAVPLTSRTTRLFLGQQLQCTQCHDHPSNEWKQGDFWAINAFFKGVRAEVKTTANGAGRREAYDHTELTDRPTDAFVRFDKRNGMVGIAFPKFLDGRKISQGTDVVRRIELGKLIADPKNDDMARAFANRTWAHFMGRGLVNPVDDLGPHNPPSHPELLDRLAKEFRAGNYDVKELIRWIMASRGYQASSIRAKGSEKEDGLFNSMALRPMSPEQLFDSLLVATHAHRAGGDGADRNREEWMRQFLFTFGNDEGDEATSFQGTIPQALMMMNGALMRDALSGKPGSFLADCIEAAGKLHREPEAYMVNQIYLAALSRYPTAREMQNAGRYLMSFPDTLNVLQDLFWALINSNEFILIH
jgi:hypothetical protein